VTRALPDKHYSGQYRATEDKMATKEHVMWNKSRERLVESRLHIWLQENGAFIMPLLAISHGTRSVFGLSVCPHVHV